MYRTFNPALNPAWKLGLALLFYSGGIFYSLGLLVCDSALALDSEVSGDSEVSAFRTQGSGWTNTASGFSSLGSPAVLTWSIAADDTPLPTGQNEPVSNSNLIAFLDSIHHGGNSPGGIDLTQRAWWELMNAAFERWDAVSGLTFNFEPKDSGHKIGTVAGQLGVRGDHRIGGHSIDGQVSPTILAYNYSPNNADMVIDTDEVNRWGSSTNNYRKFRNMMMHEIGHGIGLKHVESFDVRPNTAGHQFGTFLMEPILAIRFDGPQFDDILGAHRLYGDANEEGLGNDTTSNATPLGSLLPGQTVSVGADARDVFVDENDIDFVSIDDNSDIDFFSFTVSAAETVDIRLTPLGPTYDEGGANSGGNGTQNPYASAAKSNLNLSLFDSNGATLLDYANDNGIGLSEAITGYTLPAAGEYFVRVRGLQNKVQFFQLDVTVVPEPMSLTLLVVGCLGVAVSRRSARGQ